MITVTFLNESNVRVEITFTSKWEADRFIAKLRRSKRATLVSVTKE